jgi:hypothetical protein
MTMGRFRTAVTVAIVVLAATALVSEAQALTWGAVSWKTWTYEASVDPMTGAPVKVAAILSENEVEFQFPYGGRQRALLVLRRDDRGESVMLTIQRGQFVCQVDGCQVQARFDGDSPGGWSVATPSDYSMDSLFIKNDQAFTAILRKAKTVRIMATVYQEGSPVFSFHVAGLKW